MSDGTAIEWTDATWNVVNGCSVTSPGCTNCYAMRLAGTRLKNHPSRDGLTQRIIGPHKVSDPVWTGEVRFNEAVLTDPLRWRRPRRIFVCAHGDLFHEKVPDAWIDRVFAVMALAPQHQFQVLTQRAERMRRWFARYDSAHDHNCADRVVDAIGQLVADGHLVGACLQRLQWPLPNVWLGVSVEDQQRADERIPALLATPAAVHWVSAEPLLGPVNLRSVKAPRYPDEPADSLAIDWRFDALATGDYYWFDGEDGQPGDSGDGPWREHRIDWVVAGGESGRGARPMHPDWARSLRDQCAEATLNGDDAPVPFLFKQWGAYAPLKPSAPVLECGGCLAAWPDGTVGGGKAEERGGPGESLFLATKKIAGRLLDGVQHDGFPADLPAEAERAG